MNNVQKLNITNSTVTGLVTVGTYAQETAYAWINKSETSYSDVDVIYTNNALGDFICEYKDKSYTYITYTAKREYDEEGNSYIVQYIDDVRSYMCISYCYTYYWTKQPNIMLEDTPSFEFHAYNYTKEVPTEAPTYMPTEEPTVIPTEAPTYMPTEEPTVIPTEAPTYMPTEEPTVIPTEAPTYMPTEEPTVIPTEAPTYMPTEEPTVIPTEAPTYMPTEEPTVIPTDEPIYTYSYSYYFGISEPQSDEWISAYGITTNDKVTYLTGEFGKTEVFFAFPSIWGTPTIVDDNKYGIGITHNVTNEIDNAYFTNYTIYSNWGQSTINGTFTVTWE